MPSEFYNRVIQIIQQIPKGKVTTYGRIATAAGNPRAARQVAWILHSSSAKHGLPWWRVINSKGQISLSDPQDYAEQKKRLESEGIQFSETDTVYMEDARLQGPLRPDETPSCEELEAMHWRDRWDYEAGQEFKRLSKKSEKQLLTRLQKSLPDPYYQIWRVLAVKGSTAQSVPVLWQFLKEHPGQQDMLHRVHCAGALFKILGLSEPDELTELRQRVQWDHNGEEQRQQALEELKLIIDDLVHKQNSSN